MNKIATRIIRDINGEEHTAPGREVILGDGIRRVFVGSYHSKSTGDRGYILVFTSAEGIERQISLSEEAALILRGMLPDHLEMMWVQLEPQL